MLPGSMFAKVPEILASMGSAGGRNSGEIRSLPVFSHLMLSKCCLSQVSPKFLTPEMQKHWQGLNFTKIPKILASMGSEGADGFSDFGNFGEI